MFATCCIGDRSRSSAAVALRVAVLRHGRRRDPRLGVAVEGVQVRHPADVDAGGEDARGEGEHREREVTAVRAAGHRDATRFGDAEPDEELLAGEHVVERVAPPVHVVGVHERAPGAGRAADVRGEHRDPGRGQGLVQRVEGRTLLGLGAAVQAEHGRAGTDRAGRPVEPAGQGQAVAPVQELQRRRTSRRVDAGGVAVASDHVRVATSRRHSSRGRSGPSTAISAVEPSRLSSIPLTTEPGRPSTTSAAPVQASTSSSSRAAAGDVPDQEQTVAGVVGVQALELGVRPRREHAGLPAPAGGTERDRDELAAGEPGVGGEVGDELSAAGRRRPGRRGPDDRPVGRPGGGVGQQRVVGVGDAVDDHAELRARAGRRAARRSPRRRTGRAR